MAEASGMVQRVPECLDTGRAAREVTPVPPARPAPPTAAWSRPTAAVLPAPWQTMVTHWRKMGPEDWALCGDLAPPYAITLRRLEYAAPAIKVSHKQMTSDGLPELRDLKGRLEWRYPQWWRVPRGTPESRNSREDVTVECVHWLHKRGYRLRPGGKRETRIEAPGRPGFYLAITKGSEVPSALQLETREWCEKVWVDRHGRWQTDTAIDLARSALAPLPQPVPWGPPKPGLPDRRPAARRTMNAQGPGTDGLARFVRCFRGSWTPDELGTLALAAGGWWPPSVRPDASPEDVIGLAANAASQAIARRVRPHARTKVSSASEDCAHFPPI
jgi:hypothetical protein